MGASHTGGHSWRSRMSSSSMAARAEIAALAEAAVLSVDAGVQRPLSSSRPLSGGATRPGSSGGAALAAADTQPHGLAGATDDEHEGGQQTPGDPATGVNQEGSTGDGGTAQGEFSELSLRDVIAPSEESSGAVSKVTVAGGVPAIVPPLKLGGQEGEQQGGPAGTGAQSAPGSPGHKQRQQQGHGKPRTRRTRTAHYDRVVFGQRLTRIRATALVADTALLGAWQQSIRYLFDVQVGVSIDGSMAWFQTSMGVQDNPFSCSFQGCGCVYHAMPEVSHTTAGYDHAHILTTSCCSPHLLAES
jgi:hypothetical protein